VERIAGGLGVKRGVMLAVMRRRSAIAEALVRAGIAASEPGAPCRLAGDAATTIADFLRELVAFKRAMLDGFRCNLAKRSGAGYVTLRGVEVGAPRFPRWTKMPSAIYYQRCVLAEYPVGDPRRGALYRPTLAGVGVLDGFVRGGAAPGAAAPAVRAGAADAEGRHPEAAAAALAAAVTAGRLLHTEVAPLTRFPGYAPSAEAVADAFLAPAAASGGAIISARKD
jgi:hypothetical protein